jgi:hypothetical protein
MRPLRKGSQLELVQVNQRTSITKRTVLTTNSPHCATHHTTPPTNQPQPKTTTNLQPKKTWRPKKSPPTLPSQLNQSHDRRPLRRRPTHSLHQQTRNQQQQQQRPSTQRARLAANWRRGVEQVRRRDAAAREAAGRFPRLLDRGGRAAVCVLRDCGQLCEYTHLLQSIYGCFRKEGKGWEEEIVITSMGIDLEELLPFVAG